MNQDRLAGCWMQIRGELKAGLGRLTDNRYMISSGIRDRYAGIHREQAGISKEQAARQLKEFLERNRNWKLM